MCLSALFRGAVWGLGRCQGERGRWRVRDLMSLSCYGGIFASWSPSAVSEEPTIEMVALG